jgi:hypothetical protein
MYSGFPRGANEIFVLLVCCAAFICSYRRFGTTYRSHIRTTLEDETVGFPETSVINYQSKPRNVAQERDSNIVSFSLVY